MRFLVMVKAEAETDAPGFQPTATELAEMAQFNDRLFREGRVEYAEGLTSSAEGARILFHGEAEPKVVDGPFAETKELIAGFWVLKGESLEEVVALMKQAPGCETRTGVLEIRPIDE
ncbi:YciI family protein [Amycolatopsis sp. lyj-23]|uniref:YciI family protein n=1 Tax=Amycolatopsis sp. lyj-23 TaxID=2789283 RepID=UPI0039782486